MDTIELVKDILKAKLGRDDISLESTMKDLGVDSLDLVEVVLEVEERLGVTFEDEELIELKTVEHVVSLINKKR